jgi:hypothetical protein
MPPVRFLLGVMKWRPCEGRIAANEFAGMIRLYVISVIITTDSLMP